MENICKDLRSPRGGGSREAAHHEELSSVGGVISLVQWESHGPESIQVNVG